MQDGLVLGRGIPRMGGFAVRELDHDEIAGPVSVQDVHGPTMDEKAPAERIQRVVDPADVLEDLRSEIDMTKVGDGIGGHGGLLCWRDQTARMREAGR